jgi:hypothetical protein
MPNFNKPTTATPSVKAANDSSPPSTIRLKGYLMKQKHGKCKAWLKRYFVLYGEELRYYKNKVPIHIDDILFSCTNFIITIKKNDTNVLAVISLDHYSLVPDAQPLTSLNQKQWKYNTFCLVSDDERKFDWPDYFLQAPSAEDRAIWVDSLQDHVSQSTTVLEKWLGRLQLPPQDMQALSIYQPSITSPTTPTFIKNLPELPNSPASEASSTSYIQLPPQHHALRYYKSAESLNTFTTRSSNVSSGKRRPSDFLPSRSSDMSNKLLSSKMFSWTRSKSNNSSVSSIAESMHSQDADDGNSSRLLSTPKIVPIALECPIIHPSEYNHDDDPSERIRLHKDPTTQYFYANNKPCPIEQQ